MEDFDRGLANEPFTAIGQHSSFYKESSADPTRQVPWRTAVALKPRASKEVPDLRAIPAHERSAGERQVRYTANDAGFNGEKFM